MKKKFMLVFFMVAMLTCVMAISINAATVYEDASGNELFRYELESSIITGETGVGFAKADSDGNALTWYITATATDESSNTVYTVASIKTAETVTITDNALNINTNVVNRQDIVSINFDVGNFTKIADNIFSDSTYGKCKIICAYIPSYVTTFGERVFRGCDKLISIDIPYDSELTDMGLYPVYSTTNLRSLFIPKNVSFLNDGKNSVDGTNNGGTTGYFLYCKSLKKVEFHPDNVITEMKNAPFFGANNVEEIRFSNNLKFLGDRSFRDCNKLKTIYFGDSFEGFYSNYMFYRCSSLTDLYIPATVGTNTTGLTYRWYNVFKDAGNSSFKIHFTGTEEQFLEFYDMVIAAGGNENFASTVTDGIINTDRVVFTTDCAAFYDGKHSVIDDDDCTTSLECERCKLLYEEGYESHDNKIVIEYANGYMSEGYKKDGCTRCSNFVEATVPALFTCLGYSAPEDGRGGIAIGYTVNNEAIKEYTEATGKTLKYGVFAVLKDRLGANDVFAEDGTAAAGVINAEISNYSFVAFELKIIGFETDTQKSANLAMGAYVAVTDGETTEYSYMQFGTPNENEKYCFVSYNDIVGKPSTEEEVTQ